MTKEAILCYTTGTSVKFYFGTIKNNADLIMFILYKKYLNIVREKVSM